MSDYVLNRLDEICQRLDALEKHEHGPGYHEHLLDHEEHAAHHAEMDKPKDNRKGERRSGVERRVSTEKYEGEERRSA